MKTLQLCRNIEPYGPFRPPIQTRFIVYHAQILEQTVIRIPLMRIGIKQGLTYPQQQLSKTLPVSHFIHNHQRICLTVLCERWAAHRDLSRTRITAVTDFEPADQQRIEEKRRRTCKSTYIRAERMVKTVFVVSPVSPRAGVNRRHRSVTVTN